MMQINELKGKSLSLKNKQRNRQWRKLVSRDIRYLEAKYIDEKSNRKSRGQNTNKRVAFIMLEPNDRSLHQKYCVPEGLHKVLSNNLQENPQENSIYQDYIQFFKNLQNTKTIPAESYIVLLLIFLDIQAYEAEVEAQKYDICIPVFKTNIISVPNMSTNDIVREGITVAVFNGDVKCSFYVDGINEKDQLITIIPLTEEDTLTIMKLYGKPVTLRFSPCSWGFNVCFRALHALLNSDIKKFMYPTLLSTHYKLPLTILKWNNPGMHNDHEQQQAVINILNQSSYPLPYILFGPPGTGKTTTIVEAILQIWQQGDSNNILVCATSNTALDVIAEKLLTFNIIPSKHILRMYSKTRKRNTVSDIIIESSNFYEEDVILLPQELMLYKNIVLTTLMSCARLIDLELPKGYFSYVIIDEASQCTETEVLIPFVTVCTQNSLQELNLHAQVVLCGDPYQLGPVVRSKPIEHLFGKSALERIMDCEPYRQIDNEYNPRYITRLKQNYRSREPIIHLSNKFFYNNALKACFNFDEDSWTLNWKKLKNKKFPVVFCAVHGKEQTFKSSKSVYNQVETEAVIHFAKRLMNTKIGSYTITANDIGVVTPFTAQKTKIEESLSNVNLREILVGTVDVFQGKEKNVIIISTVRSNTFNHGEKHIGFLSHPKRFNVALTRAKIFLLIIGNPEILSHSEYWKGLWDYCSENNACIEFYKSDKENIHAGQVNISKNSAKKNMPKKNAA